jgi:predicted negative regulator of RcsB-dependent stress response
MKIFEGLLSYEIVLLTLGVLLFVVLLGLLVYSVMKQTPTTSIATLFVLPILMVGFPSVQKFKFENLEVEVARAEQLASANPADPAAQQAFEDATRNLDPRRVTNPELLTKVTATQFRIAEAQMASGQRDRALSNVDSALRLKPQAEAGVQLKRRLTAEQPTR